MTNKDLARTVERMIEESGYKKNFIAEQLGIANQNFSKLLRK